MQHSSAVTSSLRKLFKQELIMDWVYSCRSALIDRKRPTSWIIDTWLSFCCYFFFVFPLLDLTQQCHGGEQTSGSALLHSEVTARTLSPRLHSVRVAESGEWFGVTGLLNACLQSRECRLLVHMLVKCEPVAPTTFFLGNVIKYFLPWKWSTSRIWWRWLAAVFSHADCVSDNVSTAAKDPSGFATVSHCCYLLIGFQHVALLLYSVTERVCFVSAGPQRFIGGHRSFSFQNNFKGKTYQLEKITDWMLRVLVQVYIFLLIPWFSRPSRILH